MDQEFAGQGEHVAKFALAVYEPMGQATPTLLDVVVPSCDTYKPALTVVQAVHEDFPAVEYEPAGQGVH